METRRALLRRAGTLGTVALAGCAGGSDDSEAGDAGTPDSSASDLETHVGTDGLDSQPVLGPAPDDATGVVVAFEDPSCPTCARWKRRTFPTLREELIDTGEVAFVFRGYPVVYPWGEPASKALEATYARDAEAFWALEDHYFANQGSFDADSVLAKTESFLAETAVDGAAVVAAVENGEADGAVQLDLDAGEAAGIQGTPGFLLFRDGAFQTKVTGAQSYEVFETALGF